jgi:hypothetical protein
VQHSKYTQLGAENTAQTTLGYLPLDFILPVRCVQHIGITNCSSEKKYFKAHIHPLNDHISGVCTGKIPVSRVQNARDTLSC